MARANEDPSMSSCKRTCIFPVFNRHGKGLSQEPHSDPFGFSLHGCRNLDEHSFGFSTLVGTELSDKPHETYFLLLRRLGFGSISVRNPFSNLDYSTIFISQLGQNCASDKLLENYSSLLSLHWLSTCSVCRFLGFSSPRIAKTIHFMSSVFSVVSPTRCHGPN